MNTMSKIKAEDMVVGGLYSTPYGTKFRVVELTQSSVSASRLKLIFDLHSVDYRGGEILVDRDSHFIKKDLKFGR